MNEELNELLEKLNKILENVIDDDDKKLDSELRKALEEECSISIEKKKNGESKISVEGRRLSILIALAGLEKNLLEQFKIPNFIWEKIKESIGIKEIGKK